MAAFDMTALLRLLRTMQVDREGSEGPLTQDTPRRPNARTPSDPWEGYKQLDPQQLLGLLRQLLERGWIGTPLPPPQEQKPEAPEEEDAGPELPPAFPWLDRRQRREAQTPFPGYPTVSGSRRSASALSPQALLDLLEGRG